MINRFTIDVIGMGENFQVRISIVRKETYSIVVIRNFNNTENSELIDQLKSLILRDFQLKSKVIWLLVKNQTNFTCIFSHSDYSQNVSKQQAEKIIGFPLNNTVESLPKHIFKN